MKTLLSMPWGYLSIFVYLKDEDAKKEFVADLQAQGYKLPENFRRNDEICHSYYKILPNKTVRRAQGWAINMLLKALPINEVYNNHLLIDYAHFKSLDDYLEE
ncbi:MAG: hypothetical protein E7370_01050 [Clostridiales bacterium]|nr:hypothetical protein [Clostridiales bacterium]